MERLMEKIVAQASWFFGRFAFVVILMAGTGCNILWNSPEWTPVPEASLTAAIETVVAELTQAAPARTNQAEENQLSPTRTPQGITPEPTNIPITTGATAPAPTPTNTAVPTPTLSLVPQATPTMEIIFQDNFHATQGWYTYESDRYRMEYVSGKYHIHNNLLTAAVNSVRKQIHDDIYLEVEAARVSGPPNGYFGLVCRFQDDNNYYAMVIGSDGSYGIIRMMGGSSQFISPPPRPTEVIRGGFSVNRIGGSCINDRITLYVNGVKVVEVVDDMYTSGFIGLVVGTTSVPGLEVSFDNFIVKKP
jgi:hypothetical protein